MYAIIFVILFCLVDFLITGIVEFIERHRKTPLTPEEMNYCLEDEQVVAEYIERRKK